MELKPQYPVLGMLFCRFSNRKRIQAFPVLKLSQVIVGHTLRASWTFIITGTLQR